MRVLVVEDEPKMAGLIARGLRLDGTAVDVAGTGERALEAAAATSYDAIVLDLLLPGIDGFETCRRLRERGQRAPVLMLTARGDLADRVQGLDLGADDYLVKPFAFAELRARLRALLRRPARVLQPVLEVGELRLDPGSLRAWRGAVEIELTQKQFSLLEVFMRNPGQVLSRVQLLDHAWDERYETRSNIIDVYVKQLRERIDLPFGTSSLQAVRGVGYRLREDGGGRSASA